MNNLKLLLSGVLVMSATAAMAQGAKNIRINEILTNNTQSIQDEFGQHEAWIELENTSFTTYNVRGMYFTTDRSVLDPKMSVPERIKRMSVIPNGEPRTQIGGRQHLVFFCNSAPTKGKLHLSLNIPMSEPFWIGFYNGNATDLIDSVSVPALAADQSFSRQTSDKWSVKKAENVTPGTENFIKADETKDAKLKREDPHGFGISLLAMGIVFFCLTVLFLRGSQRMVSIVPCKTALRASELADMVVVVIFVFHRLFADRAVLAVVIDALVLLLICRKLVCAEIDRTLPVLAKARDKRIVSIKDQGHVIVDSLADNALDEFRMAISGHLVPVKVIDDKILRMEVLENMS